MSRVMQIPFRIYNTKCTVCGLYVAMDCGYVINPCSRSTEITRMECDWNMRVCHHRCYNESLSCRHCAQASGVCYICVEDKLKHYCPDCGGGFCKDCGPSNDPEQVVAYADPRGNKYCYYCSLSSFLHAA